ncbi:sensor histidine kinase [Actinokineospora fastidiosa]|nr:nitrate- and nitrite sensing domain-containing protein [Actinokineospora fastidiosa]
MASKTESTEGGEATRWSTITRWRDWNLPVKLSAVILVPVVFAIVLGGLTIGGQIDTADSFRRVDRLVVVNDDLRKVLTWLQRERTKAATLLTGGTRDITSELTAEQRSADAARANLVRSVERAEFANPATADRHAAALTRLGELDGLRARVAEREIDGASALAGYTAVIESLLAFDRAAAEEIADPGLSGTAGALHHLEAAKEAVYYQQALVAMGIARGGLSAAELEALRSSQARYDEHVREFRAVATPAQRAEFDRMLDVPGVAARVGLLRLVVGGEAETLPPVGVPLPITSVDWNGASELTSGRISNVSGTLGREIITRSEAMRDAASDGAGLASVVLTVALVIAAAVIITIGRQLLTSLRLLRREAFRVAEESLPAAVERIRGGKNLPAEPEIDPVPITTGDEVGEVARAFDAVHRQALKLATEQAGLRANYSDVFVNLSRRSQGLVQRQLHLLERLERDEEDADQLAVLFQLDHLATRMRRNNENLMVLSGADLVRRASLPAPLADLLRAAVSEIEQYQRVVIQPPANVLVVGYAVGDIVRLTAELLDNATAFSAPATQVTVSSHHSPGGAIRVEIADRGIGLTPTELAEANARLADAGAVDASTSRRMGLFVVGRLAARLGVRVWLEPAIGQGMRAIITVPADLTAPPEPARVPVLPAPAAPPAPETTVNGVNGTSGVNGTNGHGPEPRRAHGHAAEPDALPRRTNGHTNGHANGSPVPGVDPFAPWTPVETTVVDGPSTADLLELLSPGDGASMPDKPIDTVGEAPAPSEPDTAEPAPLPRRQPRKPVDAEVTQNLPETAPDDVGDALFSPAEPKATDTGWWDTTVVHERPPAVHETTPIFDEMVSAWFRAVSDAPDNAWDFAADTGFRTARTVSSAEAEEYTDSGLPRRTPRRNLVPGSVDTRVHHRPSFAQRSAHDLRDRLSSYQRGVHRARGVHHTGPAHGTPDSLDLRGARWRFAADVGWQAADAVARSVPAATTPTGLPRRTPRERLLPGSLETAAPASGPRVERDAEALRSRLSGFQRGLDRGRDSLAQRGVPAGSASSGAGQSGRVDHEGDGDA